MKEVVKRMKHREWTERITFIFFAAKINIFGQNIVFSALIVLAGSGFESTWNCGTLGVALTHTRRPQD